MLLKVVLLIIVLATSVPAGIVLARLCSDELKVLRKWFYYLIVASLLGIFGLIIFYRKPEIILTLIYVMITSFVCLIKGR